MVQNYPKTRLVLHNTNRALTDARTICNSFKLHNYYILAIFHRIKIKFSNLCIRLK